MLRGWFRTSWSRTSRRFVPPRRIAFRREPSGRPALTFVQRDLRVIVVTAAVAVCGSPATAEAEEIRVWTARALATVLAEVGGDFERATGHRLIVTTDLPPAFLRRANAGEPFDLLISGSSPVDEWIRDGRLVASTRTDIARSGIGVAVRAGARKPDISTVEAFRRTLLGAKSIAYLKVGSGIYLDALLARLGVTQAIAAKAVRPDTDIVAELVAKGDVELGIVVITQIVTTGGVDFAGPLPSEIQSYVTFVAGVSALSRVPNAASELIAFLTRPRARAVIEKQGMEPSHR
jgi:molybdate transport system substrate-binding protein